MRRLVFTAALAFSAALLGPAAALADTADSYNLFVLGDMRGLNSSTQGRVAVGHNATLQNYQVASGVAAGANLVVGGNLTATSLQTNGQSIVGGTASLTWGSPNVQPSGTPLPADFSGEVIRLKDLSTSLAAQAATGATVYNLPSWAQAGQQHGAITLTGAASGLNIFDLDAAKLGDASSFTINLAPGSTALINVSGLSGLYYQTNFNIVGGDASSLLWNFSQATSLSFYNTGSGFQGSVLAPLATYNPGGWGAVNGQMIVGNFYSDRGSTTVNNVKFAGDLLAPRAITAPSGLGAIPEPATWAMLIVGFGLIGGVLRRRVSPVAAG